MGGKKEYGNGGRGFFRKVNLGRFGLGNGRIGMDISVMNNTGMVWGKEDITWYLN